MWFTGEVRDCVVYKTVNKDEDCLRRESIVGKDTVTNTTEHLLCYMAGP